MKAYNIGQAFIKTAKRMSFTGDFFYLKQITNSTIMKKLHSNAYFYFTNIGITHYQSMSLFLIKANHILIFT